MPTPWRTLKSGYRNAAGKERPNQSTHKAAAKIYRKHEAFRSANDATDESGTPSPSPARIKWRCEVMREILESQRWVGSPLLEQAQEEAEDD